MQSYVISRRERRPTGTLMLEGAPRHKRGAVLVRIARSSTHGDDVKYDQGGATQAVTDPSSLNDDRSCAARKDATPQAGDPTPQVSVPSEAQATPPIVERQPVAATARLSFVETLDWMEGATRATLEAYTSPSMVQEVAHVLGGVLEADLDAIRQAATHDRAIAERALLDAIAASAPERALGLERAYHAVSRASHEHEQRVSEAVKRHTRALDAAHDVSTTVQTKRRRTTADLEAMADRLTALAQAYEASHWSSRILEIVSEERVLALQRLQAELDDERRRALRHAPTDKIAGARAAANDPDLGPHLASGAPYADRWLRASVALHDVHALCRLLPSLVRAATAMLEEHASVTRPQR